MAPRASERASDAPALGCHRANTRSAQGVASQGLMTCPRLLRPLLTSILRSPERVSQSSRKLWKGSSLHVSWKYGQPPSPSAPARPCDG